MTGQIDQAHVDLDAAIRIAAQLRKPAHLWQVRGIQAELALAAGELVEAAELMEQAFALGERAQPEMATPIYRTQRYTLADLQGRLAELESAVSGLAAEYPARPVFRCVLTHLNARLGRTVEAQDALDGLTKDDVSALPFDQEWLFGMSLLAESSALLGVVGSTAVLYRLLLPWATFNAADHPEGIRGSVSRYLGLLATILEQLSDAERHFREAVAMNERMGARPWLALTQRDYARMLLERAKAGDREHATDLLESATAIYGELGMTVA